MLEREVHGTAVIGMAARFPGAPDLETYRRNIEDGVDAITEAPKELPIVTYYDPSSNASDRLYCNRGGFLPTTIPFNAAAFGIMPIAAQDAEPEQLLALDVAARALADAGYADRPFPRERTGVILGRGGYVTRGNARLEQLISNAHQLVDYLRAFVPGISEAQLAAVKADYQAQLGPCGPDFAIGITPNLVASRIANRLDLGGTAYTLDAACASSLVAVEHACRDLESGRSDLVLAGGVHMCHSPSFWSVFCQLGAVSRSQTIRPFDERADGLLIGEGLGVVVLKRLADAERDGDRIYAVIRGVGVSSDGRDSSPVAPRVEGQIAALRRAWEQARLDPATIGLIEAHGTGTPTGDAAEVTTLARFFGPPDRSAPRAVLGSVKSMIGHAMPAAGAAGLIKAVLALHHRVLPASLHCEEPRRQLRETRFEVLGRTRPWEDRGAPRRAAVSAFGFGGINAHVVLEEHAPKTRGASLPVQSGGGARRPAPGPGAEPACPAEPRMSAEATSEAAEDRVLLLAAPTPAALLAALDAGEGRGGARALNGQGAAAAGPCRLALFNPTAERRARARAVVARGEPWRDREDLWFAPAGLIEAGGRVVFLFPGMDANFRPRIDDVARRFGLPMSLPDEATDLVGVGFRVLGVDWLLHNALRAFDVQPDMLAGHSIGEWAGLLCSGMVPQHQLEELLRGFFEERVDVPDVVFVAVGCGIEKATSAIAGLPDIAVSLDNCPHQVILCGRASSADAALDRLSRAGVLCQKFPFRAVAYHAPSFADYMGPYERSLSRIDFGTPSVPLWSATTCAPYPEDCEAVRRLAIEHLVRPVRFRELTDALYAEGGRAFVQVGTGSLVGFVEDTLRARPHLAISANVPARSGLSQLRRVVAALWVEGARVAIDRLDEAGAAPDLSSSQAPAAAEGAEPRAVARRAPPVQISLHSKPIKIRPELVHAAAPRAAASARFEAEDLGDDAVAAELAQGFSELTAAQGDVLSAGQSARASRPPLEPREVTEQFSISVETHPFLVDHSFYPQPPGWPNVADRYPVVPMMMLLEIMMDAANRLVPELVPIGLEAVHAYHWLAIAPPLEIKMVSRFDGVDRVEVKIEGFAAGTVVLAADYPAPPPADLLPLKDEAPVPISAAEFYGGRWMFHGPAYQGVVAMGPIGADGIRGTVKSLPADGALLDSAAQLLGYWLAAQTPVDCMVMPVRIERVRVFGPHPPAGEHLEATVRVLHLGPSDLHADVELTRAGRVWARLEGMEERRFECDERIWNLFQHPERVGLTAMREGGYGLVKSAWKNAATRGRMVFRYLGERERLAWFLAGPRRQTEWLLGRIAVKDCVRNLLWARGHGDIFPVEIEVESDPNGRPVLRGPLTEGLRVSLAHKDDVAVAIVGEGRDVGIDIERVEPRGAEFEELAFTPEERALLPVGAERDAWVARLWVAKEAAAKAQGTGLGGQPKRFVVREVAGERLLVTFDGGHGTEGNGGRGHRWVETRAEQQYMVGWTCK